VVIVTDPYGRILGFLDRSRYFSAIFLSSSSSIVLTRLSGPRYRPTTFFPYGGDSRKVFLKFKLGGGEDIHKMVNFMDII
jgi:hypothetical protein